MPMTTTGHDGLGVVNGDNDDEATMMATIMATTMATITATTAMRLQQKGAGWDGAL